MSWRPIALAGIMALLLQGCAAIGLTFLGAGAGVAADTGTSHTLSGTASRTFAAPADQVRRATHVALRSMAMRIAEETVDGDTRTIVTHAGNRTIEIELQRLTAKATRMSVVAKHHVLMRDRATADQVIEQTQETLDHLYARSPKGGEGAASPATAPARERQ